jgi:MinD superfamily P-loop ATPase
MSMEILAGEQQCRECGCTEERACEGGCFWAEPDLCSGCSVPLLKSRLLALEIGNRALAGELSMARFVNKTILDLTLKWVREGREAHRRIANCAAVLRHQENVHRRDRSPAAQQTADALKVALFLL